MSHLRNTILKDIIEMELFLGYTLDEKGNKVYTYESEWPDDKEKFETEGSTWIVFIYDCYNEYYQRNKERLEQEVNNVLKYALTEKP